MKKLSFFAFCGLYMFGSAQAQHKIEKIWQTDTVIAIPESVLPDMKAKLLYVSLIDGGGWVADGKGGVGKLGLDGKIIDTVWITGLNAPKGLGRHKNLLYVADINQVVVINIKKGRVEKKITVEGSQSLNDLTVNNNGEVFVSDTRGARIYKLVKDIPSVYLENMQSVNGLKAIDDELYILSGRRFLKADAQKNLTDIATLDQAGDGLEPVGNGDFIATSWIGYIYYVHADGKTELLKDTRVEQKNSADIGYDPIKRIIYLPTFNGKTVEAYQLK